jgi:hypothetical protein
MSRHVTGQKRGPKGPRIDYEPALRAMIPLVLRGVPVSNAAGQVVDRGLVTVISDEASSARRLRALFAEDRARLLLEYRYRRERAASLFAGMREFAQTIQTIVRSPDVVRTVLTMRRIVQSPDAVRAIEALAGRMAEFEKTVLPVAVRVNAVTARRMEELRSRLRLPVEILADAFRNFGQPTAKF